MIFIVHHAFRLDFNPRPPRGGRLINFVAIPDGAEISIHAPREGGDFSLFSASRLSLIFQSTPPARGATTLICGAKVTDLISIHAPREGGDTEKTRSQQAEDISIHAPREGGDSKDAQFYLRIFDK